MKNNKFKVMTIVGTRPEIIRLSRIIDKFDSSLNHILVHTGQNFDYELNEIFFEDLLIRKPDHFLECNGDSPAATIANVIKKSDEVLKKEMPDAVLILGDTNSSLAAISAKRLKIPIFHMEAGNRCFDMRVPEEINRKIIDHIADINLPYTSIARDYLLREGMKPELVIKTGSPLDEVINFYLPKALKSSILSEHYLKDKQYFLVSVHREENLDSLTNFEAFCKLLNSLAERYKIPVIVSTHPRTRKKIDSKKVSFHEGVKFLKPLSFTDYLKLQINAKLVLSDSGTITEESSLLKFPALNIRDAHERPEGFEEGVLIFSGLEDLNLIHQSIDAISSNIHNDSSLIRVVEDYKSPALSEKMLRIILSYTHYVNRYIWRKTL
jgi:UDP-N-acetylglucosamine 2-epimerase